MGRPKKQELEIIYLAGFKGFWMVKDAIESGKPYYWDSEHNTWRIKEDE